jgi:hypothetical protein
MNGSKSFIIYLFLFLAQTQLLAINDPKKDLFELAEESKSYLEGFQKNSGETTFSYHTFRNDVTDGMITRCTDGKSGIEWETQTLPETFKQEGAAFLWIAAIDLTSDQNIFDVSVNGIKRFEIPTSTTKNWEISSADGGQLSIVTVETDQHGDAHGYMMLNAPSAWLNKGCAQKIGIKGRANNNNSWVIVFQAADAVVYLQNSVLQELEMNLVIEQKDGHLMCYRARYHAAYPFD